MHKIWQASGYRERLHGVWNVRIVEKDIPAAHNEIKPKVSKNFGKGHEMWRSLSQCVWHDITNGCKWMYRSGLFFRWLDFAWEIASWWPDSNVRRTQDRKRALVSYCCPCSRIYQTLWNVVDGLFQVGNRTVPLPDGVTGVLLSENSNDILRMMSCLRISIVVRCSKCVRSSKHWDPKHFKYFPMADLPM